MITDFSTYTNSGLQNITYHGKNSLTDYGILLAENTSTSNLGVKSSTESLPKCNGNIDFSDIDGRNFGARTLIYEFKIFAETREDLKLKESDVKAWLNSEGDNQIIDSDYLETEETTSNGITTTTTTQWIFQDCHLKSLSVKAGDEKGNGCIYEYLTAVFEAYPYLIKQGTVNERVLKFTDNIGTNESATIAINNNAYTLTTSSGSTVTGTLPTGERKYRITAYSEQIPTIMLGQTEVEPEEVFILPASGTIVISGAGFGYFEMWKDTREVRL